MAEPSLDALVRALLSDPPRHVDPATIAAADPDELATALRDAVAGLPATEQRTRLAAAFRAMTTPPGPRPVATSPPHIPRTARRSRSMRSLRTARAGLGAGVVVVALAAGGLAGMMTEPDAPAAPVAREDAIPVLEPIASGSAPPSAELVAGLLPPDPAEEIERRRQVIGEQRDEIERAVGEGRDLDPEDLDLGGVEPADTAADDAVVHVPGSAVSGYLLPTEELEDASSDRLIEIDRCAFDDAPSDCDGVPGTITLIDGPTDPMDAPAASTPGPEDRTGRPPVEVRARSSSDLTIVVPAKPDEVVEVRLVRRRPADRDGTCSTGGTEAAALVSARAPGDIVLDDGWERRHHSVSASAPGPHAVCVAWFDDFDPPHNLERVFVPVDIAGVAATDVVLSDYRAARGILSQPRKLEVWAVDDPDGCGADLAGPELLDAGDEPEARVLCTLDGVPGRVLVRAWAAFEGHGSRTWRALIRPSHDCDEDACTTWHLLPIDGTDGDTVGTIVIGLRQHGGGPGSVAVGDESAEVADGSELAGPRLRWDQVSIEPDRWDPARRANIAWATDVPATAQLRVATLESHAGCPPVRAEQTEPVTEAEVIVDGLCPGLRYYVDFHLEGEQGRTFYGIGPVSEWDERGQTAIIRRSAPLDLEPLRGTVSYDLEFDERYGGHVDRPDSSRGVVPSLISLALHGEQVEEYSQWFSGPARFGLDCAEPPHFNRSGSGIPVELRGGTLPLPRGRFEFHHYDSYRNGARGCPTIGQQWGNDRGRSCGMVMTHLTPARGDVRIDRLTAGEKAVYTARSPRCGGYFSVTLTVEFEEERHAGVLRG